MDFSLCPEEISQAANLNLELEAMGPPPPKPRRRSAPVTFVREPLAAGQRLRIYVRLFTRPLPRSHPRRAFGSAASATSEDNPLVAKWVQFEVGRRVLTLPLLAAVARAACGLAWNETIFLSSEGQPLEAPVALCAVSMRRWNGCCLDVNRHTPEWRHPRTPAPALVPSEVERKRMIHAAKTGRRKHPRSAKMRRQLENEASFGRRGRAVDLLDHDGISLAIDDTINIPRRRLVPSRYEVLPIEECREERKEAQKVGLEEILGNLIAGAVVTAHVEKNKTDFLNMMNPECYWALLSNMVCGSSENGGCAGTAEKEVLA